VQYVEEHGGAADGPGRGAASVGAAGVTGGRPPPPVVLQQLRRRAADLMAGEMRNGEEGYENGEWTGVIQERG
jgi:hypothetical protein